MQLGTRAPSVAAVAGCCLFVSLGVWQLERAEQKERLSEEQQRNAVLPPLDLDEVTDAGQLARWVGRRAEGGGALGERLLLLDNQTLDGRPGYRVLTPLITGRDLVVLVDLGWVAAPPTRDRLPPLVDAADAPARVAGMLGRPPSVGLRLAGADNVERLSPAVWRIQAVRPAVLREHLGVAVAPVLLQLEARQEWGYRKQWPPPGSGAERHRAYAVQWFAFAAIAALLWGLWRWKWKRP